jgi:molybdopterin-guanine dinucleotide biosynthesis protein A
MENLITLFNERSENYEAVCYEKEGFIEPLCTIYEVSSLEKLKIYFENGGESLSRFLKTLKTKIIKLEDRIFLQNVNSRKEFLSLKNSTFSND